MMMSIENLKKINVLFFYLAFFYYYLPYIRLILTLSCLGLLVSFFMVPDVEYMSVLFDFCLLVLNITLILALLNAWIPTLDLGLLAMPTLAGLLFWSRCVASQ